MYFVVDNTGTRTGPFATQDEAEQAARDIRWEITAGATKRAKNWKGDEPDFVREWLGRWVKTDARYVYPVHAVPRHRLLFAPQRLIANPFVGTHERFAGHPDWYDHHAAVRDLPLAPRGKRAHQWLYVLGADFGYNPDPFAIVLWAFTPDLPDVYEMFSWKQIRVHTDDQGAYLKMIWDTVPSIIGVVGDPAGKRDDFDMWRGRMNLPIEEANKAGKNTLEEFLADDIRRERVHLRDGSPLHTEMRHLVYLPTKPGKQRDVFKHRVVNGVIPGDHCCFVAGTRVATDAGPVAIENLVAGDRVHGRTGEVHRVEAAFSAGCKPTWRLTLEDETTLIGTHDHPIWTGRGWIPLALLMPGNEVEEAIALTDESVTVRSVEPTGLTERVYNLTVAGTHEYFANGILVHNCDAGRYAYQYLTHYLAKLPTEKPAPGSPQHWRDEEEREQRAIDDAETRRARMLADGDEMAREYGGAYGEDWG